jgi:hypothetical protein
VRARPRSAANWGTSENPKCCCCPTNQSVSCLFVTRALPSAWVCLGRFKEAPVSQGMTWIWWSNAFRFAMVQYMRSRMTAATTRCRRDSWHWMHRPCFCSPPL